MCPVACLAGRDAGHGRASSVGWSCLIAAVSIAAISNLVATLAITCASLVQSRRIMMELRAGSDRSPLTRDVDLIRGTLRDKPRRTSPGLARDVSFYSPQPVVNGRTTTEREGGEP